MERSRSELLLGAARGNGPWDDPSHKHYLLEEFMSILAGTEACQVPWFDGLTLLMVKFQCLGIFLSTVLFSSVGIALVIF